MESSKVPVTELGERDLDAAIQGNTRLVVDCWAPWCGDCRRMAPVFDDLAADNAGKIVFAKVNLDINPAVKAAYQIMAVPTFLVFKDGKLVASMVEPSPRKSYLQTSIQELLA
jgi:thioredoxin 1